MAEYFARQVHHVPGRLRLKLAAIKRNDALARFAEQHLCVLDGVRNASANPLTGSLVVRFDPEITDIDQIFDALKAHGLLDAEAVPPMAAGSAPKAQVAATVRLIPSHSLADVLVDKALQAVLERCAVALVAALI